MSVDTTTTDLATIDNDGVGNDIDRAIEQLKSGKGVMSTFKGEDFGTKLQVIEAMTNAEPLDNHMGKVINLRNVVIQSVTISDQQTGVTTDAPRIVLVDESGAAYSAVSGGIFSSLKNFFAVLGTCDQWPAALPVVASRVKSKNNAGSFFTLSIAKPSK
jgi:hypothetical protein